MQGRTRKHTILEYLCQNGPTALHTLREPHIGGSSADTQMRKLRNDHGIPLKWRYRINASGEVTNTTEYYLGIDPRLIDIENLRVKNQKPVQGALDLDVKPTVDLCSVCGGVIGRLGIDGCVCDNLDLM